MTEENSDPEALEEALRRAKESMSPPDDPDELDPDYPPDYTPEDRVEHVLRGEYPTWRSLKWIAAAAETDQDLCWSVIRERLAAGEIEISEEGIRRNRYHVYFEQVRDLTEKVTERPKWL
jgi:hypothetical protein